MAAHPPILDSIADRHNDFEVRGICAIGPVFGCSMSYIPLLASLIPMTDQLFLDLSVIVTRRILKGLAICLVARGRLGPLKRVYAVLTFAFSDPVGLCTYSRR